jgi:hypothetical protein
VINLTNDTEDMSILVATDSSVRYISWPRTCHILKSRWYDIEVKNNIFRSGHFFFSSLSLLKCPRSLRFSTPEHFISHGVPSYLNASFENVNGPMSFSHGIKDTGFLR